ncbi:thioesterase family protein [Actinosynnema sp. NPDC020468]|uniref:acyl-CoA thioesterase n=1 Tax=Actinosynnema sp. NPDC020468 TaxID=3154488 RepID=UPI0033DD7180
MRTRISFSDVDMHGNVHNGRYVAYVEDAINEFLRDNGLAEKFDPRSSDLAYHVRKVEVLYHSPIGFEDVVDVTARVGRIGRASLTFEAEVRTVGAIEPAVQATVVWVCVDPATRRSTPVPEHVHAALGATAGGPLA